MCISTNVLEGDVDLVYINKEDQVDDIFLMDTQKLCKTSSLLGVCEMQLSLRGSVKMLKSTSLDIDKSPCDDHCMLMSLAWLEEDMVDTVSG